MTWLDDFIAKESARVSAEDKQHNDELKRKETISSLGVSLWTDLKYWVQMAVAAINADKALSKRVGSPITFEETSVSSFAIKTVGPPGHLLTVTRNGLAFKTNRRVRGGNPGEYQDLTLDLDDKGDLFIRTFGGDAFYGEAVVGYLLTPFFNQ
jgi:hypothetical protein